MPEEMIAITQEEWLQFGTSEIRASPLHIEDERYVVITRLQFQSVCERLNLDPQKIEKRPSIYYGGIFHVSLKPPASRSRRNLAKKEEEIPNTEEEKKKYVDLCKRGGRLDRLERLKREETATQEAVRRHQRGLMESLRKLEDLRRDIRGFGGEADKQVPKFAADFEQMLKHPDLEKVEVFATKIYFHTGNITIEYEGQTYNIGKFRIEARTEGDPPVRIFNKTRRVGGYHHPHVDEDGDPCLGNIEYVVPELLAQSQFPALFSVCVQYLKSFTDDDDGAPFYHLESWPLVNQKKKGAKS